MKSWMPICSTARRLCSAMRCPVVASRHQVVGDAGVDAVLLMINDLTRSNAMRGYNNDRLAGSSQGRGMRNGNGACGIGRAQGRGVDGTAEMQCWRSLTPGTGRGRGRGRGLCLSARQSAIPGQTAGFEADRGQVDPSFKSAVWGLGWIRSAIEDLQQQINKLKGVADK